MRKEYSKPRLFAESFEVCEHISRSCPNVPSGSTTFKDNGNGETCGWRLLGPGNDEIILFYETFVGTCNEIVDDSYEFGEYNGAGDQPISLDQLFSS